MAHWNPVESLETRTLLAGTPLDWPFQGPGVRRIGRTLYIAGTDAADTIRIGVPASATDAKNKVEVFFNNLKVNNATPTLLAGPLKKVLINGAAGDDSIIIATKLTAAFNPRKFVIRGGVGVDTITGGDLGEHILGEAGNDILSGGAGRDWIEGGDGNDSISGGPWRDRLYGGFGDDSFLNREPSDQRPASGPSSPRDLVAGGPGADKAQADPADNILDDVEDKNAA